VAWIYTLSVFSLFSRKEAKNDALSFSKKHATFLNLKGPEASLLNQLLIPMKKVSLLCFLTICSLSAFCQEVENFDALGESNHPGHEIGSVPLGGFQKPEPKIQIQTNTVLPSATLTVVEQPVDKMPVLRAKPNVSYHLLNASPNPDLKLHLQIKKL
jgi:hypothetical protein